MMKQDIFNRIFCLLLAFPWVAGLMGCSEQDMPDSTGTQEGYITLRLSSLPVGTRVTNGEDTYNENAIHRVDFYFYFADAVDTDAAVYEVTGLTFLATGTLDVPVKLPLNEVNHIFGTGNRCKVLALVNLPVGASASTDKSLGALRKKTVEADFTGNEAQTDFVMYGEADVALSADRKSASGTVSLQRAAAKIRLAMSVADEVEDDNGNKWQPGRDAVRVYLSNGTRKACADGSDVVLGADDYFSISPTEGFINGRLLENGVGANSTGYPYSHAIPLYSYPNRWKNEPSEEHRTYLTLQVPWRNVSEGTTQYRNCYYQVPVNVAGNELAANTYYRINLSVNMLGSFVQEQPMELEGQYKIVDWGQAGMDVDIHDNRYLVVNQTDYVMNNVETITIPYYTSHETEISNVTMTYYRYNETGTNGAETSRTITPEQNELTATMNNGRSVYTCNIDQTNNTLTFTHPLIVWNQVTDQNGTYFRPATDVAYSRYVMEITIRHKDQTGETQFQQTVKIVQYPGMYITLEHNGGTGGWNDKGYVFVNNSNAARGSLGGVHGLTGGNTNPNMYIINLTQLNATDGYTIADPRSLVINNGLSVDNNGRLGDSEVINAWTDFANVVPMEGGDGRQLAHYYPTDESVKKAYYIAPQIRIASSYGVTNPISRTNARRRCASYQEQGYPAGRWRIPTKGEMEYIVKLSSSGKIPVLFSQNETYWSAQGPMTVPNGAGNLTEVTPASNSTYPVRCVYDEWYWKNEDGTPDKLSDTQKGTFTWGDAPKRSPQQ